MSAPEKKPPAPPADLAQRLYVELVARNTTFTEGNVKMAASAANLATLSLKLADAFAQAEMEFTDAKAPVTTYKLGGDDIAAWMK